MDNSSVLFGYFIGMLIDFSLIFLFSDQFENKIRIFEGNIFLYFTIRLVCIICLLCIFILTVFVVKKIKNKFYLKNSVLGIHEYRSRSERQRKIDEFDNIACDGLLICECYMNRFNKETKPHIKEFYYYEILHHSNKASLILEQITYNKNLYIFEDGPTKKNSCFQDEYIELFRVKNFLIFLRNIYDFLIGGVNLYKDKNEKLEIYIVNLGDRISKSERFL